MIGYSIKGIFMGNNSWDISNILDNTIYLSKNKALKKLEEYKTTKPNNYSNYIIEEIKIIE